MDQVLLVQTRVPGVGRDVSKQGRGNGKNSENMQVRGSLSWSANTPDMMKS